MPGEKWAKKLFPELRASQAVEKLWDAILKTSRVTDDPIKAWEDHNRDLHDRCEYLNKLHIRELRYKSSNGTDFTVGMIPEAQFCGGGETSLQGIFFNPNIPTEECFISPMRGVAEGHRLRDEAAELSGPADKRLLDPLPRGARPSNGTPRKTTSF